MATYITISNKDYINVDGDFLISWVDKGKIGLKVGCLIQFIMFLSHATT